MVVGDTLRLELSVSVLWDICFVDGDVDIVHACKSDVECEVRPPVVGEFVCVGIRAM